MCSMMCAAVYCMDVCLRAEEYLPTRTDAPLPPSLLTPAPTSLFVPLALNAHRKATTISSTL
jgi:hypothetical protein